MEKVESIYTSALITIGTAEITLLGEIKRDVL